MDKELHKCLIDFYSKLEAADIKWKETTKSVEGVIIALGNQAEQLRHVTSPVVDKAEVCKVEGLRERLTYQIFAGIEDEVNRVQDALLKLYNCSQDLKNRLTKLEAARSKVSLEDESMKELVNGTAKRPKLNLLLEWAIDAVDYYRDFHQRLSESLKALNYKEPSSIEKLAGSFKESDSSRAKIDRILAYTQFLAREQIPK